MNQELKVTQTAGIGSYGNTFVAEQHNNIGLSVTDATDIAFEIFRQYYPVLRQEALNDLRKMVEEELLRQKPTEIMAPAPRIVVPTLQGASLTEETNLRSLYAKLLASAMNKETAENAHPSFIRIIEQMSSFDAMLIKKIADINNSIPVAEIKFVSGNQYLVSAMPHYYSPYFDMFDDNWQVSFSIENLSRLRLFNLFEGSVKTFDYEQFKNFPFVKDSFEKAKAMSAIDDLQMRISEHVIQLNDFGMKFIQMCVS